MIDAAGCQVRLFICGTSVLLGVAGCASRAVSDTSASVYVVAPANDAPSAAATSTISAETTNLRMGGTDRVTFAPPPAGAKPTISYATAIAIASGHDQYPEQFAAGLEIVSYGDFTDLDARRDYGNGSYGPPIYDHVLAVDVRFVDIPVANIGGPAASEPESPQPPVAFDADVNIIINATSGAPILTFEDGTG